MFVTDRSPEDAEEICSFCDDHKASALWMGKIDIFVCKLCAVELLPQLIADAIVGSISISQLKQSKKTSHEIKNAGRIMERFEGAFSGALIRKIQKETTD